MVGAAGVHGRFSLGVAVVGAGGLVLAHPAAAFVAARAVHAAFDAGGVLAVEVAGAVGVAGHRGTAGAQVPLHAFPRVSGGHSHRPRFGRVVSVAAMFNGLCVCQRIRSL